MPCAIGKLIFRKTRTRITEVNAGQIAIDAKIKAKWNKMISELITFRITKAKAKVKFGVKESMRTRMRKIICFNNINTKWKRNNNFGELISLQFPCQR